MTAWKSGVGRGMKEIQKKRYVLFPVLAVALIIAVCAGYVGNYYHSEVNIQEYQQGNRQVAVTKIKEGLYLDGPGEEQALIFYPGAKVEYMAYLPLLYGLSDRGVDCFLVKMPCNLAFLGKDKAEKIMESYDYKSWYLSGHSLGGAMAAAYAAEHLEELDGIALLAAYPTKSLVSDSFAAVSVYGSEDRVLNMEKMEEGRKWMPSAYTELCLEGGNHAGFGNYGRQKGDGIASLSREEQQEQTVAAILDMITAKEEF